MDRFRKIGQFPHRSGGKVQLPVDAPLPLKTLEHRLVIHFARKRSLRKRLRIFHRARLGFAVPTAEHLRAVDPAFLPDEKPDRILPCKHHQPANVVRPAVQ